MASHHPSSEEAGMSAPMLPPTAAHPSAAVVADHEAKRRARRKLLAACVLCFLFMGAEVFGGYLANSLAIMTDVFALWLAEKPATETHTFGYHRVEVVGALVSVLIIWLLTGILVYEAIQRVIHPVEVKGEIMFIVACAGFVINLALMKVLHQGGHGHSHGGHSHGGHGHSHGGAKKKKAAAAKQSSGGSHGHSHSGGHGHSHEGGHGHSHNAPEQLSIAASTSTSYGATMDGAADDHSHSGHSEGSHGHSHGGGGDDHESMSVRSAFIHAVGDLVQSIGVMIAGALIWYNPDWHLADPICTFIFSILVLFTTIQILNQGMKVILDTVPDSISQLELLNDLEAIEGVKACHDLHVWSIAPNKPSVSVHINATGDRSIVLCRAQRVCAEHGILHSTIQVEEAGTIERSFCHSNPMCSLDTVRSQAGYKTPRHHQAPSPQMSRPPSQRRAPPLGDADQVV